MTRVHALLALALLLAPGAPARAGQPDPERIATERDPLEGFNRKIFWFNNEFDVWVLEPVAKGWDFIAPQRVQTSLAKFFGNLRFPIDTLNDALQLRPLDAGRDVARFLINTTVGVLGFFDPATGWGFPPSDEDFGQTLAHWGVPSGPFLMLPLLGPSNPRDTVGLGVDYAFSVTPFFVDQFILLGVRIVQNVNDRSLILQEVVDAREASLDYYTALRNAYVQGRRRLVLERDEAEPAEEHDDLYYPELETK